MIEECVAFKAADKRAPCDAAVLAFREVGVRELRNVQHCDAFCSAAERSETGG